MTDEDFDLAKQIRIAERNRRLSQRMINGSARQQHRSILVVAICLCIWLALMYHLLTELVLR